MKDAELWAHEIANGFMSFDALVSHIQSIQIDALRAAIKEQPYAHQTPENLLENINYSVGRSQ